MAFERNDVLISHCLLLVGLLYTLEYLQVGKPYEAADLEYDEWTEVGAVLGKMVTPTY